MRRHLYFSAGATAVALGTVGIFLPLLPTVPFYILAAFCFGKCNPAWEAKMLAHPQFGPHIVAWRERRAIPRRGKILATLMLFGSGIGSLFLLPEPWRYIPISIAALFCIWMWTRPD